MTPLRRFSWRTALPVAVLSVAGLLVGQVLLGLPWRDGRPSDGLTPTPTAMLIQTPRPGEWATLAAAAAPSSVAIQTFQGGKVIRSGTGTVVSSDGLIVTVIDVVPLTSPSASYQVTLPERVLRAQVVRRDSGSNLALLKTESQDLTIAQTERAHIPIGSSMAVVGASVDVSSYLPYFFHAWLSFDPGRHALLDASPVTTLSGGRAISSDGRQVGIVFIRGGQVRMIWSERMDELVASYLQSLPSGR